MTVAIDTKALPFGNPGALTSYLHTRSIIELRALAQKLGIYQTTMRRRVVLIEAIVNAKAPKTLPVIPAEGKHVVRNEETRDFSMYLDGQLVGCARTETEADATLDQLVDEIARHTRATTADMAADAAANVEEMMQDIPSLDPRICRMNPLGTHWTICGAPGDGPCMCDVVAAQQAGEGRQNRQGGGRAALPLRG